MESNYTPTIRELLDSSVDKFNDRTCIKYFRNDVIVEKSYGEIRRNALAFCRKIREICPNGEHIALVGKSSYEYIISLTGILISGNVAIPVAPDTSLEAAVQLFNDADITYVLYDNVFADKIEEVKAQCPQIKGAIALGDYADFEEIFRKYDDNSEYAHLSDVKVDPKACALIIYTSGSTGERKGVMLSTYAVVKNIDPLTYSKNVNYNGAILSVLPMYHIFCFVADYVATLQNGNELILNGEIRDMFKNMLVFKPVSMRVVPMIAQAILARINAVVAKNPELSPEEAAAQVTGGKLKWLFSGGAYLDPVISYEFQKYGMFLRQGYGMSETGCKVCIPDEASAVESVGRIISYIEYRIKDGEIQLKTPCQMLGYYKNPEATKAAFTEDGWLKTGDNGYVSDSRELFITGRVKNLIILANGENVSPEGLERQLKKNLLVNECLVYAENGHIVADIFPDASYAELNGITDIPAALEKYVDEMNVTALPSHTIAKINITAEPLPKGPTGKILRKQSAL